MVPPPWQVEISKPARRQIARLSESDQRRVLDKLDDLRAGTARIEKLEGCRDEYHLRVGSVRVLLWHPVPERVLVVTAVQPRGRAYRG